MKYKKAFTLEPLNTTNGIAICDGTRDAKISFTAINGQRYTHICRMDWLRYYTGRIPVEIHYEMKNGAPDISMVMTKLEVNNE